MKYENARDIFPPQLLRQIQKYAAGKLVYIPIGDVKRGWGETSGYKRYLAERNRGIREKFMAGAAIEALADEYYLSVESIKRIVYAKKEVLNLEYRCALSSAQEYAKAGKLEEWVHTYLLSDGHNREFSDGLKLFDRYFVGPLVLPLSFFSRCCGPEEGMKYRVDKDWFEKQVEQLTEVICKEPDMPPLILHYVDSGFELCDGNHRYEAYARLGKQNCAVIVWMTEQQEYADFMKAYAAYLA